MKIRLSFSYAAALIRSVARFAGRASLPYWKRSSNRQVGIGRPAIASASETRGRLGANSVEAPKGVSTLDVETGTRHVARL